MDLISTGSPSFDKFLRGGIRVGMITHLVGESGSGKSQFCFSICANLLKKNNNCKIVFIDTAGTFRPERILEITDNASSQGILSNIYYIRPYSVKEQFDALIKIKDIRPKMVIHDTIASNFSVERKYIVRHMALMKFIHELAHIAINNNCAILTTNMVRNIIHENDKMKNINREKIYERKKETQQEFMNKSVSLSVHIKLKFEIISIPNNVYRASFLQPVIYNDTILFQITKQGIC